MQKQPVWLCGNWAANEWAEALSWLNERAACHRIEPGRTDAVPPAAPAAILIAQTRPGDFQEELRQLTAAASSAPIFVLAGPWCEGELRSGTPFTGGARIAWRRWRCAFHEELAPLLAKNAPPGRPHSLPPDAQLVAKNFRAVRHAKPVSSLAVIYSECRSLLDALADALAQFHVSVFRPGQTAPQSLATAGLVLYDGWPLVERHQQIRPPTEQVRELLLLDWPRPADADRARASGIHAVIPLPFLLSDLARAFSDL